MLVRTCRICLDSEPVRTLISPCCCSGTCKWVHRDCLEQWRNSESNKNKDVCGTCQSTFVLVPKNQLNKGFWLCLGLIRHILTALATSYVVSFVINQVGAFVFYRLASIMIASNPLVVANATNLDLYLTNHDMFLEIVRKSAALLVLSIVIFMLEVLFLVYLGGILSYGFRNRIEFMRTEFEKGPMEVKNLHKWLSGKHEQQGV